MLNRLRNSAIATLLGLLAFTAPALATLDDVHQWSATAASNTDVGGTSVAEGMQRASVNNALREMMSELRRGVANQGSDIASAGTTSICATGTSVYAKVTGTTTITALGTANAGCWRIITFTGALTITQNATSLILPGAASITTVAGDVAGFISEGSGNWRMIWFSRIPFTSPLTLSSTAVGTLLTLTSTDAGAAGAPDLVIDRNSATPAAADIAGRLVFTGRDSTAANTTYAYFEGQILDPVDGTEDGKLRFNTIVNGSLAVGLAVAQGVTVGTGAVTDKGAGSLNASAGVYVNGHGTVAQVVSVTSATYQTLGTIMPYDNSIPQITEGDEIFNLAITPTNASSILRITFTGMVGGGAAGTIVSSGLFVDATANALFATGAAMTNGVTPSIITLQFEVSAASTSARTYRIRAGNSTATDAFLNGDSGSRNYGGVSLAVMKIEEILPQ